MDDNNFLKLYNNITNCCDTNKISNLFDSLNNILIISSQSNIKTANFWSIILNQKYDCIATHIDYLLLNKSKLQVYQNILIIDEESEKYIKNTDYNKNIIFLNQIIEEVANQLENNVSYTLINIMIGLSIYYKKSAYEILNKIIKKINNKDLGNIEDYDVVVCDELISCGINFLPHKFKIISTLDYIDNYKNNNEKVLLINSLSQDDTEIISSLKNDNNLTITTCDFDDNIDEIIYGLLLCLAN